MSTATGSRATAAQSSSDAATKGRVPLVKADKALLSLRSSGHDFFSAAGEVIDNSLEAGANAIKIRTFTCMKKIGTNKKNTEVIERVAFGDDGEGMTQEVLHQALQLGFSTRYNSRKGLGRFGVGAKLGGISQVKRIEDYSRQDGASPWLETHIDLDEIEDGADEIPVPDVAEIPTDCEDLVGTDHGTLVVWSKADHLQERETGGARPAKRLETDLVNYIARTFRKFLDGGKEIWVNDVRVRPHDPLFLMHSTRFHESTEKTSAKIHCFPSGAKLPKNCQSRLSFNPKSGQLTFQGVMSDEQRTLLLAQVREDDFRKAVAAELGFKVDDGRVHDQVEATVVTIEDLFERSNPDPVSTILHSTSFEFPVPNQPGQTSPVEVTVTLLPPRFWERDKHTDRPGGSKHAKDRNVDKNEGTSILRAGREIFYGVLRDVQPPVKELDRFVGVEIRFRPDLDECFQVRNVKKGAEPVNGLRDKLKDEIYSAVVSGRNQINSRYATLRASDQQDSGIHRRAEDVVKETTEVSPQPRAGKTVSDEERNRKIEEAAEVLTRDKPHKKKETVRQMKARPLSIVPQAWPGNEFIQIEHLGSTAIVRLNTQHPFYTEIYAKLVNAIEGRGDGDPIALARLVQEGLDLLISAYAQAEAVEVDADERYANLRTYWGLHLKNNVEKWARSAS